MTRYGFWERMLDMLTGAYNRSDLRNARKGQPPETNIGRLFYLIAEAFELIYENAERVKAWDDLDNAQGAVLDRYGANLGVDRGAANDALYRIFIKVKLIAQLSGGDNDAILNAAAELLGVEYSDLLLEDVYPAKIALYVDQDLLSEERLELIEQIAYAVKRAMLAGVGLRLYLRTYRTYRYDLTVSHGAVMMTRFRYDPTGKDREGTWNIGAAHAGWSRTGLTGLPPGGDQTFERPVFVAHSGYSPVQLAAGTPGGDRAFRSRGNGAGGVFTRTHIKPKRMD